MTPIEQALDNSRRKNLQQNQAQGWAAICHEGKHLLPYLGWLFRTGLENIDG